MKFFSTPVIEAPNEDDTPSVFAAVCGAYYDSAADTLASNFGAFDALSDNFGALEVSGRPSAEPAEGAGAVATLILAARKAIRNLPGAARERRAALSARFSGVIAIDRGGDRR